MSGSDFGKDGEQGKDKTMLSDKIAGAFDGHDDPDRGSIDRAANAIDVDDDPDCGPINRAADAIGGLLPISFWARTAEKRTWQAILAGVITVRL